MHLECAKQRQKSDFCTPLGYSILIILEKIEELIPYEYEIEVTHMEFIHISSNFF
jgi:hypothetical protein